MSDNKVDEAIEVGEFAIPEDRLAIVKIDEPKLTPTTKQILATQILDLISHDSGFTPLKIIKVQEKIQKIVPAYQRKPDHLLVIMNEVGEHLREIEASFKDWRKAEDDLLESNINWSKAAEELADVVILVARLLVDSDSDYIPSATTGMVADLLDAPLYVTEGVEAGQLLASALVPLINPTTDWASKISSFYYICQYAGMMPFGVSGLRDAWIYKVNKVIRRTYVEQF